VRLYREYLAKPISGDEREAIVRPVQRSQLTGGPAFIDAIAERLGETDRISRSRRPRKGKE
jgi:hypothetical protein